MEALTNFFKPLIIKVKKATNEIKEAGKNKNNQAINKATRKRNRIIQNIFGTRNKSVSKYFIKMTRLLAKQPKSKLFEKFYKSPLYTSVQAGAIQGVSQKIATLPSGPLHPITKALEKMKRGN